MALAGQLIVGAFTQIQAQLSPGLSTQQVNDIAYSHISQRGGELLFHGYRDFPAHTCISVNDEVVHGLPGRRQIVDGDLLTVDIGVRYEGFCADAARTFCVGTVSEKARKLLTVAESVLEQAIMRARVGNQISDITEAIDSAVSEAGYFGLDQYVGHGIGRQLHEDPQVPNSLSTASLLNPILRAGAVLAIEPIVCESSAGTKVRNDGWTVGTLDHSLAVHVEHTVAVTEDGPRILT